MNCFFENFLLADLTLHSKAKDRNMMLQPRKFHLYSWKNHRLILSFFFVGLMAGCSLDAQILELSAETIRNLSEKASAIEVTPSSSQGVYSTDGYEAQVSVNYYYSKPEVQTSQGYSIQTTFQSSLYKE